MQMVIEAEDEPPTASNGKAIEGEYQSGIRMVSQKQTFSYGLYPNPLHIVLI